MMLDLKNRSDLQSASKLPAENDIGQPVEAVRLFLRRRYKLALVLMTLSVLAALAYLKLVQPSYTAGGVIEIANREGGFFQQQAALTQLPADVDRDVEFTKSYTLAEFVARKLQLDKDPEFGAGAGDLLLSLRRLWSGGAVDPDALRMRAAVAAVLGKTRVAADPSGSSFTIAFTSRDPEKSAVIANAIADAFIAFQTEADTQLHQKAADWLVGQSDELAKRAKEASAAVSEYVRSNNIVLVEGKPLTQQDLDDMSKRVEAAKAKSLDADFRLDKISASLRDAPDHILDATSAPETLQDPAISASRERYVDLTNQLQTIRRDFNKAPQKLQDLVASTKAEIIAELSRLQTNALNDRRLARQNYERLLGEQKVAVEAARRTSLLNGQLRELQGAEQNYRKLYENFLQHSAEAARELSFPVRAARISERAKTPFDKSWPKPLIVLAAAMFGGLGLGFGIGALRDLTEGVFRTVDGFEAVTQLKCLAVVPAATMSRRAVAKLEPALAEKIARIRPMPVWAKIKLSPNSRFVSELISLRLALRRSAGSQGAKVLGVTSALAGEGKSSLVAALGVLMAQSGQRVVIVDLDFRNPTLSGLFALKDRPLGLSDALLGRRALEDVLAFDADLNLTIAPSGADVNIMQSVELLASAKMQECIAKLRQTYDVVLVDLPPLLPVTDVKATTEFIDRYLLVAQWAKTPAALTRRAMDASPEVTAKMAGGLLNQVDFKRLSQYDSLAKDYYMRPEFSRYLDFD